MSSLIAAHTRLGAKKGDRLSCSVNKADGKEKWRGREIYTSVPMLRVSVTKIT